MRQTMADFRAAHPDIPLLYHPIQANYPEKIQLMLGTDTAPDIFMLDALWAPALLDFETLAPLDGFLTSDPDFDLSDIDPRLLKAFHHDGRHFGLPKDYSTLALFYNPLLLEEQGLSAPKDWAELASHARRLTLDANGDGVAERYGLGIGLTFDFILPFILQNGGQFLDEDGHVRIHNEGVIGALRFLQDLRREGVLGFPSDVGAAWNMDGFGRKGFAMTISGHWALNFMMSTFPNTPYALAPLPKGRERATLAFVVGYVMPRVGENHADAWQVLRYLTGHEGQSAWAKTHIGLPTRRSIAPAGDAQVFVDAMEYAHIWQLSADLRVVEEAESAIERILLLDEDVEAALAHLDARLRGVHN